MAGETPSSSASVVTQSSVEQAQQGDVSTQSTHVEQNAVASASSASSSAVASVTNISSVTQTSAQHGTGSGPGPRPEQSAHVVQTATATATASSPSAGDKGGDAVAVAQNVSEIEQSNGQPVHVVQAATATATASSPSAGGGGGDSVAVAQNVSEIEPSTEQSVNVVQTATASSAGGEGSDGSPAVAMNVSKIERSNDIAGRDSLGDGSGSSTGGESVADVCNASEIESTCSQRNEASVEQTAEAKSAGSLALNVSEIEHSDQIAGRDAGAGSTGGNNQNVNSAAGVCNAGGPTVNCTQEHAVAVSQTAIADGDGAVAVNKADVATVNQIAGRDAGAASTGGDNGNTNSAAGVCNAGGPTVNCTQESTLAVTQTSVADGDGAVAISEADVSAVNQIAGRDAGAGSTGGNNQNVNSAAGVCNAGGPTVNCTQESTLAVTQTSVADGDAAVAISEADVSAVNQIAGRDAGAGSTGVNNQNVNSAAGVCNAGGPTVNCTQENTVSVEQTTTADGDQTAIASEVEIAAANQIAGRDAGAGSVGDDGGNAKSAAGIGASTASKTNVAAVNQIAGRDAGAGSTGVNNQNVNSAAGVCNAGGPTVNCTQENTVTVAQEAAGGTTAVAAVNQIAGRDAGAGSTGVNNQNVNSAAGVCNAGGPTVNCTQENTVTVAQEAAGDTTAVAAVNQIAGRDAGAGSTGVNNQNVNSAAGVCNAGGPTVNCTQANVVAITQEAADATADVVAVNQIAGRDTYQGAAQADNQSGDSSADVCNADGGATNCAQANAVAITQEVPAATAEVVAANQIAGRDAYEGSARGDNQGGDSFADVCNSGVGCSQDSSVSVTNEPAVRAIEQIAGRNRYGGSSRARSRNRTSRPRLTEW